MPFVAYSFSAAAKYLSSSTVYKLSEPRMRPTNDFGLSESSFFQSAPAEWCDVYNETRKLRRFCLVGWEEVRKSRSSRHSPPLRYGLFTARSYNLEPGRPTQSFQIQRREGNQQPLWLLRRTRFIDALLHPRRHCFLPLLLFSLLLITKQSKSLIIRIITAESLVFSSSIIEVHLLKGVFPYRVEGGIVGPFLSNVLTETIGVAGTVLSVTFS